MTIAYRPGTPDDAERIAGVFRQSFIDTFAHLYGADDLAAFLATKTPAQFREEHADPSFEFALAEDDGELAGYVKLGPPELPVETPPDTVELCQLYVLKPWHGSGVAAGLMDRALEFVHRKQARHVQLSVYVDNIRARRFYERYGFHAVGRYDFMVGSHADEDIILRHVVMQADE
jgi:ribosomal protein S18 acetylase RimI-like enzyme